MRGSRESPLEVENVYGPKRDGVVGGGALVGKPVDLFLGAIDSDISGMRRDQVRCVGQLEANAAVHAVQNTYDINCDVEGTESLQLNSSVAVSTGSSAATLAAVRVRTGDGLTRRRRRPPALDVDGKTEVGECWR